MKKLVCVIGVLLLITSCGNESKNSLTVNGNIKGLKKGTLYLQHIPDTVLITVDSLEIKGDGNFSFSTELESPEIFYLYLDKKDNNDINDRITFFAEQGVITVNTDWNTFDTTAKISGSKSNDRLDDYRETMSKINKRNMEILLKASQQDNPLNQTSIDSLERISNSNTKRGYAYAINFALNNKDSYVAPYIALKEVPDANIKYLDSIYNVLTPDVANSKYGKELKSLLESKK
ncbi:DUF4369 domain-containing protein [Maribacter sp. CXY002]|uniref:DUF4369 domain-containing protein n=1 Tax=Maribacter luteocoastalis TaxID=3407671 RepID=UPI003B672A51